jgi:hypothetical protein
VTHISDLIENTDNCQDVFVTEDGTGNTKVLGWVTNADIEKESIIK